MCIIEVEYLLFIIYKRKPLLVIIKKNYNKI